MIASLGSCLFICFVFQGIHRGYKYSQSLLVFFILLGEECDIDINECDSNPCHHAGTCLDQPNGYTCHCPHGWVGANCEIRKYPSCELFSCGYFLQQEEGDNYNQKVPITMTMTRLRGTISVTPVSRVQVVLLSLAFCHAQSLSLHPTLPLGMRVFKCHPKFTTTWSAKKCASQAGIRILSKKCSLPGNSKKAN